MPSTSRSSGLICWAIFCLAVGLNVAALAAESKRVSIEGLISAAPVPAGFAVTRKDLANGDEIVGHYLIFTKDASPTRALVQIERREIKEQPARVATLKAYVNAAAGTWQKQGYAVKVRALPKLDSIDFAEPVSIDLDATKEGEVPLAIHMEILFDKFAYQTMCVSPDKAEAQQLIEWCKSVRPLAEVPATQPAK